MAMISLSPSGSQERLSREPLAVILARPEIGVHLHVAPPGCMPRVPLLDRQGANLALVMVGADFRQSHEVEARYPGGPPYVFSAVPAPKVLLPDPQEGEKLGARVDALAG